MDYSEDNHRYYSDMCKQLSKQLHDTNNRHRGALREVRRARIVSALTKKLFRLKSARYSAKRIAERALHSVYHYLSLDCGAVYAKHSADGGFKMLASKGFLDDDSCDLSRRSAMPEYALVSSDRENSGISLTLNQLTRCESTVWCFNQAAGLAILLGSNHNDVDDAWRLGKSDRDMLHSILELVANVLNEADARAEPLNPMRDELTGLPTRKMLLDRLERESRNVHRNETSSTAVLYLDIDRFRAINQQYGHLVGDKLIVAAAQRLSHLLRPGDLLGRIGVDEFAILADGLRVGNEAELIAKRIIEEFRKPIRIEGHSFYLSLSVGIAEASQDRTAIETFRDANVAMFSVKSCGGASYSTYGQEMRKPSLETLRLEEDLQLAIEREEFTLYYQPIFSLQSRAVVALEALLRWHHPKKGVLRPNDFLSLADRSEMGLILGDWVIDKVIRDLNIWCSEYAASKSISVCINIDETQFAQENFVKSLGKRLRDGCIDPQRIRLEVSEKTLQECRSIEQSVLSRLRDMGVKIMLDDFGTGYSSLERLHQLPIDTIKIDQHFIQKLTLGGRHSAFVNALIKLARNLDKQIVAEGAETREQLEMLSELGCDFAQGYTLGKPMAASKVGQFLGNQELAIGQ